MAETLAHQATPAWPLIRTLGLVSALCGLIIVTAYQLSLPSVVANRQLAAERAVFQVLPAAKSIRAFDLLNGRLTPAQGEAPAGALRIYRAYDANGRLLGLAAEGAAKGYADLVRVMIGYSPACACIVGMAVVSQRETPGIGDRILSDPDFRANFQALDAHLGPDGKTLAHDIQVVKHGSKTQPWQIDAISGATITSRAVGRGVQGVAGAVAGVGGL